MARVVAQLPPLVGRHAQHEHVVVKARLADHGQNLAGVGLHDQDGPGLAFQQAGAFALQADVDGELEVAAGLGRLQNKFVVLTAKGVDFHLLAALGAAQLVLVGELQPLLAHGVAKGELGIFFQLLLVGLGHIAEHMGQQRSAGIVALLAHHDLQARIEHGVGLDAGQGLVGQVGDEDERLKGLDPLLAALDRLGQHMLVHARPFRDLVQGAVQVLAVLAHQSQGKRRFADGQGRAVLVEDAAPGRADEHLAQLVVPGHVGERAALVDLQVPQAQSEQAKEHQHQGLEQDQPGTGRVLLRGFGLKPHEDRSADGDG